MLKCEMLKCQNTKVQNCLAYVSVAERFWVFLRIVENYWEFLALVRRSTEMLGWDSRGCSEQFGHIENNKSLVSLGLESFESFFIYPLIQEKFNFYKIRIHPYDLIKYTVIIT